MELLESLFFNPFPREEAEVVRLTRSSEVLRCDEGIVLRLLADGALKQ